jgi:hypothetical protein
MHGVAWQEHLGKSEIYLSPYMYVYSMNGASMAIKNLANFAEQGNVSAA